MVRTMPRKYRLSWNPEAPVTPLTLDKMFDDMDIGTSGKEDDHQARDATRRYCIDAIAEAVCSGTELRVGRLEDIARKFYDGYRMGWRDRITQSIR